MNDLYPDVAERLLSLMRLRRVYDDDHGPGDTVPGLVDLCHDWIKPDFLMADVGAFRGVSTRVFACFARLVWAVDCWTTVNGYRDVSDDGLKAAYEEFCTAIHGYRNIVPLKMMSAIAAHGFLDAVFDAVYLDADHAAPGFLNDVRAWLPKMKPTGLLMGHDWSCVKQHWPALGLPQPVKVYPEDSWVVKVEDIKR